VSGEPRVAGWVTEARRPDARRLATTVWASDYDHLVNELERVLDVLEQTYHDGSIYGFSVRNTLQQHGRPPK